MSFNGSDERQFLRTYRRALLGAALAWRAVLLVGLELPEEAELVVGAVMVVCAWGLAPYMVFAGLAHRIGHRPLLIISSLVLFVGDVVSGMGVLLPGASTNAVALATYPLLAIFGLFPMTWLVSRLLGR